MKSLKMNFGVAFVAMAGVVFMCAGFTDLGSCLTPPRCAECNNKPATTLTPANPVGQSAAVMVRVASNSLQNFVFQKPFLPKAQPVVKTEAAILEVAKVRNESSFNAGFLDRRREYALGMIETANDDFEVGQAGEVSRYQIMPAVWRRYSQSKNYTSQEASLWVAKRHWASLREFFLKQAKREPTDFDMYVLWNTRYGYYANCGFEPARLNPVVRDRAQRFVNLVVRGVS